MRMGQRAALRDGIRYSGPSAGTCGWLPLNLSWARRGVTTKDRRWLLELGLGGGRGSGRGGRGGGVKGKDVV
jgi:hypothetical protein